MIAQYGDWTSSQKSRKGHQDASRSVSPPSNKSPDPYDLQNLTGELPQMKEETTIFNNGPAKPSSTGYDHSNYALPEFGTEKNNTSTNNPSGTSNEYLVLRMMQETGQEREISVTTFWNRLIGTLIKQWIL